MNELSESMRRRIEELQRTQKKALDEVNLSKQESIEALNRRIEKLNREKEQMEKELQKYIKMYEGLAKYFPNPHEGSLFEEKGQSNVYESLSKVSKSSIHIF